MKGGVQKGQMENTDIPTLSVTQRLSDEFMASVAIGGYKFSSYTHSLAPKIWGKDRNFQSRLL